MLLRPAAQCVYGDWESRGVVANCRFCTLIPSFPIPTYFAAVAFGAFLSGQSLAATDLEDIGDGDGLGTSLALGGDNGDGRPGHVCGVVPAVS